MAKGKSAKYRVENVIEDLFADVGNEFDLKYGDITPDQWVILDNSYNDIAMVLKQFVEQNQPSKIGKVI